MAKLVENAAQKARAIPPRLLVGRSAQAVLRLGSPEISGEHAVIEWTENRWTVRDLASRNGTFVNSARLAAGVDHVLNAGDQITFGPTSEWLLLDDAPPELAAVNLSTRDILEGRSGLLTLAGGGESMAQIYRGARGRWVLDMDGELGAVEDGQLIQVGSQSFQLQLPGVIESTPSTAALSVATAQFEFQVSSDEEFTLLAVEGEGNRVVLEPREHLYVLLTLARLRLAHSERPPAERGWVDRHTLLKMLRVGRNSLNVSIHRARQQLADCGVRDAAEVVGVRKDLRRFGTDNVVVRPLD